jgi:hypothetical protein
MTTAMRIAVAAVRVWTRTYTWGMPPPARDTRRAEIESDLWESLADEGPACATPIRIVGRLLLGMPDDLRWRTERIRGGSRVVRIAVALSAATAVLATVWIGIAVSPGKSPDAPPAPDLRWRPRYPPPPPPPPPPPF